MIRPGLDGDAGGILAVLAGASGLVAELLGSLGAIGGATVSAEGLLGELRRSRNCAQAPLSSVPEPARNGALVLL